jgi:hypothetical protein
MNRKISNAEWKNNLVPYFLDVWGRIVILFSFLLKGFSDESIILLRVEF